MSTTGGGGAKGVVWPALVALLVIGTLAGCAGSAGPRPRYAYVSPSARTATVGYFDSGRGARTVRPLVSLLRVRVRSARTIHSLVQEFDALRSRCRANWWGTSGYTVSFGSTSGLPLVGATTVDIYGGCVSAQIYQSPQLPNLLPSRILLLTLAHVLLPKTHSARLCRQRWRGHLLRTC